jgi:hypothetical protein
MRKTIMQKTPCVKGDWQDRFAKSAGEMQERLDKTQERIKKLEMELRCEQIRNERLRKAS